MQRIRCLLIKELAQLKRDTQLLRLLFVAPLFQLLVMGFAANTDVRDLTLGIRDRDHSFLSRQFIRALTSSDTFRALPLDGPESGDGPCLVSGRAGLIVVIPRGFGEDLLRGRPAPVQVLADGADSNFAVQGLNYLQKAVRQFSDGLPRGSGTAGAPSVEIRSRVWYNPELASRQYLVPAIMALVLLVATMLVTSMALVKEREEGTLEQLMVTPLRPVEMVAGKLLPFVLVGFVEMTVSLAVILLVFKVPLRGSVWMLYGMSGLFLLTTLGLGLFISTLVRTQQQAMLVATFFVMMPFVLLAGFAFPVENMPAPIERVSRLIPLRYYLVSLRAIFLKGAGIAELWPQALILLGWGLGILGLAVARFRRRLE